MNYVTLMIPVLSRRQAVLASLGLLAVVAAVAMWSTGDQTLAPAGNREDGQLEGISGIVHFSALGPDGSPVVYQHHVAEDTTKILVQHEAHSYAGKVGTYHAFVAYSPDSETDADRMVPAYMSDTDPGDFWALTSMNGIREQDMSVTPDGRLYAYSFQEPGAAQSGQLVDWRVALHDDETGESGVLTAAAKPVWAADGTGIFYMAADGIYFFDVLSRESRLVYDGYQGLGMYDHFAVSGDNSRLVITVPSLKVMTAVELDASKFAGEELWSVPMETALWRTPVINPQSGEIAVSYGGGAAGDSGILIFSANGERLMERRLPDVDTGSMLLEYWSVN